MPLLKAKHADAEALTNELVSARTAYNEIKLSVIDRAATRAVACQNTIDDLAAEQAELLAVADDAKLG